jgi:hypothetical protein
VTSLINFICHTQLILGELLGFDLIKNKFSFRKKNYKLSASNIKKNNFFFGYMYEVEAAEKTGALKGVYCEGKR